jgi:hypothetical protein
MLSLVNKVSAADGVNKNLSSPLDFANIGEIFGFATNLLIGIGWGLVFVMLALGFIKYVTSRGEKVETEAAQKQLTYAVIGGLGLLLIGLMKGLLAGLLGIGDEGSLDVSGGGLMPGTGTE